MVKHRQWNDALSNHKSRYNTNNCIVKKAGKPPLGRENIYLDKASQCFDDEDTKINDNNVNVSFSYNTVNHRRLMEPAFEDSEEDKADIPKQTPKKKSFLRIFNIFAWGCKGKGKVSSPKKKTINKKKGNKLNENSECNDKSQYENSFINSEVICNSNHLNPHNNQANSIKHVYKNRPK